MREYHVSVRNGDGEAKGLGSLEVDDQLEAHGLLDGQSGRLGAFGRS